jgi:Tol biopolymer transport system component
MTRTRIGFGVLASVAVLITANLGANGTMGRDGDDGEAFGPWSAPVHLGPVVNSTALDAGPSISRDGLSLYFHSARAGLPSNPDLYVSHRAAIDLPWEAPVKLGPAIDTDLAEAGPTVSKNGHFLFFGAFRSGSFDVYVSRRQNTADDLAWEAPVALPWPINGPSFDVPSDYFENPHGDAQLYFASDRANGLGAPGLDLYVSDLRRDGTWSDPVYVTELNSAFQDDRPAIRADGLEIIFGSSREGSLDLYVSRRDHVHDAWSAPVNLGAVVNSTGNDIHPALSANGRTLYFASNRSGNFDLYACTRSKIRD